MPLATTQRLTEREKVKDLLSTLQSDSEFTIEKIDLLSERAIDFIYHQAFLEPDNRRILGIPSKQKNGTCLTLRDANGGLAFLDWFGSLRSAWNSKDS